jgi:hypothetical protein
MRPLALMLALGVFGACSSGSGTGSDTATEAATEAETATDTGTETGAEAETVIDVYTRPDKGVPLTAEEITATTQAYLELLAGTRYFQATDERLHGWPQSDPQGRFWYGTWYSGVTMTKSDGIVTFLHSQDGSDNDAMRTAPMLNGACYARVLWGGQEQLIRKLVRGFSAWALATERTDGLDVTPMLIRVLYPESVASTDGGRNAYFDYSLNRPGVIEGRYDTEDPPPCIYVHNPVNPHWGDVWLKNKRSKDDMGHVLAALAFLPACSAGADADFQADVTQAWELYAAWARRVEDDGYRIATMGEDWSTYFPKEDLAFYIDTKPYRECAPMLAIRLMGRDDGGTLDCGNAIIPTIDEQWVLKNDLHQIERSHQQAAAALAQLKGQPGLAHDMQQGLAWRLDKIFDARDAGQPTPNLCDQDIAELVMMSGAVGVPLTSREVRFLSEQIKAAHDSYLATPDNPMYRVFDPATPDGEYAYEPGGAGIFWRYLGAVLGACASPWWNPTSQRMLDCETVKAWHP